MPPTIVVIVLAMLAYGCSDQGESLEKSTTLEEIDARILSDPENADLFAERARFQESRDSVVAAEKDWRRAILLDPSRASYRIAMGDLYYRTVRWEKAEEELEEAIRLDPQSIEARLKLSELKLMTLHHEEAMELANEALRLDPQHAKGYFLKGWIHKETGDTGMAISSYRTAVERDPSFYDAYLQLGMLHALKGDPIAMDFYNSALEVRPRSVEALYGKGMYAQENGSDSLAMACYDQMKLIDPRDPLPWYNSGFILLEHQGRSKDAREQFSKAISLHPTYAQAYVNRGLAFELENVLDSAFLDYRQALALNPDLVSASEGLQRLENKGLRFNR